VNLKQLRVFQEVMLTGSVSQAARNLNRTQPSISSSISALEEDLGVRLFERKGRRLHPIPEAQYLLKECSEVLRHVSTIGQTIQRITSLEVGELRIACMPGPAVFYLPDLISEYTQNNRSIKTTLASRSSDTIFSLIATQQYDIGLCDNHPDLEKEKRLLNTELIRYQCVCAINHEDELAKKKVISFKDLDKKPMGTLFDDHASQRQISEAFKKENLTLNQVYSMQYSIPLLTYVGHGLAYSIIDPIAAESYRLNHKDDAAKVVFRPLEIPIWFELAIIRPTHRPISLIATDFYNNLIARLKILEQANSSNIKRHTR